jgi:hypothetical protein
MICMLELFFEVLWGYMRLRMVYASARRLERSWSCSGMFST